MKRVNMIGTLMVATLILGIVGCQVFDDAPTEVAASAAGVNPMNDFIMGMLELSTWGAYYVKDDTFLRVDIPVSGAIKVEYSVTRG